MFRVNAVTLLSTVIILADGNSKTTNDRLSACFDIIDFNKSGKITIDEMVILEK